MSENQFHYQHVTQSDYRGGATRQTKDKKEKLAIELPVLPLNKTEQDAWKVLLKSNIVVVYRCLLGKDDFSASQKVCLEKLCKKLGFDAS